MFKLKSVCTLSIFPYTCRYQDEDIHVQNIIPWRLEPGKSHDITLTSKNTILKTPVFILSYKVNENQENSRRLVLAIWWPSMSNFGTRYGWYSISWINPLRRDYVPKALSRLAEVIRAAPEAPTIASTKLDQFEIFRPIGNPSITSDTLPRVYYVLIGEYQRYKFWSFPLMRSQQEFKDLKLLTAMGNGKKNGMVMKVFGTSRKPRESEPLFSFIPEPVDYAYSEEQNPPL
ncbi:Hypothetical predicted protein [Paramuricea clavata]|uniref:Uncharacterized protein n=1 Tax=Paramuricea clavata TaxID=317549 RepID=A0A7D9JBD8_PARCT|nr:Hypothetical predicted protein [Paramuricea clavata]